MLADFVNQTPPISRVIAGLTLLTSISVHLRFVDPTLLLFVPKWTFEQWPPQLWRIVTAFFLTGPKLAIVLDSYFLFRDASECERRFPRMGDFFLFTIFSGIFIVLLNYFVVGGMILTQGLAVAYAYYWSSKEPAATNFNFIFASFSVRFLPYVMLFVLLLTRGPDQALIGLTGLLSSHLYIFLTTVYPQHTRGRNMLITPQWIHALFEGDARARANEGRRSYGSASGSSAAATGRSSGSATDSIWRQRGSGQRLGS